MSLIEQAAKRLEELRRAGPLAGGHAVAAGSGAWRRGAPGDCPDPEALVRELNNARDAESAPAASLRARTGGEPPTCGPRVRARLKPQVRIEIDLARLKELGFVTPDDPQSLIADEFRVLKRDPAQRSRPVAPGRAQRQPRPRDECAAIRGQDICRAQPRHQYCDGIRQLRAAGRW